MPRDLHRLAAPAVFRNNVRRSFRRPSPRRNISRQRDRSLDDRECEYDDYAAEIASYNRLRRGDRSAANDASSASRHTHESLSCYGGSTGVITSESDDRNFTSRFENDDHLRVTVPAYRSIQHNVPYISDEYIHSGIGRMDHDDSQQKKHKKKRKHHHCHSRNKMEKHSENGSTSRPPRDTVAALIALANYDDFDHGVSSLSPVQYYGSPRKSRRKGSCERKSPSKALANYDDIDRGMSSLSPVQYYGSPRKSRRKGSCERKSPTVVCTIGSEVIAKTENAVSVNVNLSSPNADCTRDNLSLGECTDDEDNEAVDMHTKQKSHRTEHNLPHIQHSEYYCKSSVNMSDVSTSESTKKLYSDSTSLPTEDFSMQFHHRTSNSPIPNATSTSESKTHREKLPADKSSSSNRSEEQSTVHLKHSPVNKQMSVVNDGSKTTPDGKCSTQNKSHLSESTQNRRKKSATGSDQRKAEDDTSLPRFVTCFAAEVVHVKRVFTAVTIEYAIK